MMNTILKFSLVSIGLAYSINGYSASFDCAKASSPFEKTICSNPNLSSLDEQLANVYKTAKESATNPDQLKTEQIAWIKATRNCGTDAGCIQQAYKARIVALSPQVKVAQSPPPAAPTPQVAPTPQAAKTPTPPPKKAGPVQLLNTQNKIATIGSCYSVLGAMGTIDPNSAGSMANYTNITKQANAAKPSFENGRNPAPAGMPPNSWNLGWNYTGQIIGDSSDADKLKAFNTCMSIL